MKVLVQKAKRKLLEGEKQYLFDINMLKACEGQMTNINLIIVNAN